MNSGLFHFVANSFIHLFVSFLEKAVCTILWRPGKNVPKSLPCLLLLFYHFFLCCTLPVPSGWKPFLTFQFLPKFSLWFLFLFLQLHKLALKFLLLLQPRFFLFLVSWLRKPLGGTSLNKCYIPDLLEETYLILINLHNIFPYI